MMKRAMQFLAVLTRKKLHGPSATVTNLVLVLSILVTVCILEMTCDCLIETILAVLCMLLGSKSVGHDWWSDLLRQSLPAETALPAAPNWPDRVGTTSRYPEISLMEEASTDAGDSTTTTPAGSDISNSDKKPKRYPGFSNIRLAMQQAAKDGDLPEVLRLFEFAPCNVQSFNAVLNACIKAEGCAAAEQWIEKMRQANVTPNQASYCMLIQGWAKVGELASAERWMEELRRSSGTPNQGCFLAILMAFCKKNRMQNAEHVVQEMIVHFPSTRLQGYTVLVDAYAKLGDLDNAEKWMRRVDEGEDEVSVVSYGAILDACAKFPHALKAREWHERMLAKGIAPNERTFTALITALANCGFFQDALRTLESMTSYGLIGDAITFSSLLAACAKAREIRCAERVFDLMQLRGIQPNIFTYTSLARAYANCGKWQEAERLSESLEASGLLINDFFLYALLLAYAVASPKQSLRAEKTFVRVIQAGHVEVNSHLVTVLYRAVGRQRAKAILAATSTAHCMANSATNGAMHDESLWI